MSEQVQGQDRFVEWAVDGLCRVEAWALHSATEIAERRGRLGGLMWYPVRFSVARRAHVDFVGVAWSLRFDTL